MSLPETGPVAVHAELDQPSRWLWLVKWLLVIPHLLVLIPLFIAVGVLTLVALIAILITGRYPRAIFEFNVGVLRWGWRVSCYTFGVLSTDRYPPFTLADVQDYPARLEIAYPERLSRGLALVKWWLLAIPQYLVLAVFFGGTGWFGDLEGWRWSAGGGLVGLLVIFAAIALLFTGRYPDGLFAFVVGLHRWGFRVAAYSLLMTDRYPPFRLDQGGAEPGPPPSAPTAQPAVARWTAGRVVGVSVGALLALIGLTAVIGGIGLLTLDSTQRDAAGYLRSPRVAVGSPGYAVTSPELELRWEGTSRYYPSSFVGDVAIRATGRAEQPVFVGIGPAQEVRRYLEGVRHSEIVRFDDRRPVARERDGGPPRGPPADAGIWTEQAGGTGTQTVTWPVQAGDWTVVVMNASGAAGVSAAVDVGATVPGLPDVGRWSLIVGAVLLLLGAVLIIVVVRQASTTAAP